MDWIAAPDLRIVRISHKPARSRNFLPRAALNYAPCEQNRNMQAKKYPAAGLHFARAANASRSSIYGQAARELEVEIKKTHPPTPGCSES